MFENHHNAKQHNVNQKASNKQKNKKKHIQLHMWYNLTGYQAVYNLH